MVAVVWANEMVRESGGAGVDGAGADRCAVDFAVAAIPCAREASNCVVAAASRLRTLDRGSRIAAARAATQTACRWPEGPRRMNRQTSAATAAANGICQREFSKK